MPYDRPTLQEISLQAENDFNNRLGGQSKPYRFSIKKVTARVIAGIAHLLYGNIDWVYKQAVPDTAESSNLERWALIWGLQRKLASRASGNIVISGSEGSVVPQFTTVQTSDGIRYLTLEEAKIEKNKDSVVTRIQSLDASSKFNLLKGYKLSFLSPIAGIKLECFVDDLGINDGTDSESDDALRDRLLKRIRNAPCAGSQNDYMVWANETPSVAVTRSWCFPSWRSRGNIGLAFVCDDNTDIIPNTDELNAVRDYVSNQMPCEANLFVFPLKKKAINLTFEIPKEIYLRLYDKKLNDEIIDTIKSSYNELFKRVGGPYIGKGYDQKENYAKIRFTDLLETIAVIKSKNINFSYINLVDPISNIELDWEPMDDPKILYPTIAVVGDVVINGV